MTSSPRSSSAAAVWKPMKPAAPVTRILIPSACFVLECWARSAHDLSDAVERSSSHKLGRRCEQGVDACLAHSGDRVMLDGEDDGVERSTREFVGDVDAVFVFGERNVSHGIVGYDLGDEFA